MNEHWNENSVELNKARKRNITIGLIFDHQFI
jgi:hypothetical protein